MARSPLETVPMPERIARLPRDHRGYPVPFFCEWRDGKPIFPIADRRKWTVCVGKRRCWVCGEPLGRALAFVIGPMCTINMIDSEPPAHRECASYALRVCPFLVNPAMRRVPLEKLGGDVVAPGGIMDDGNPGVMALWMTRSYSLFRTPTGTVIKMGEPFAVSWFARGRTATPAEAAEAFVDGSKRLLALAAAESGEAGMVDVVLAMVEARKRLPDPSLVAEVEG